MAVKFVTTRIRGAEWGVNIMSADRGVVVLTWLLDLIAEPAGRIFAGAMRGGIESLKTALASFVATAGEDALALALAALTKKLADPSTLVHVREILKDVTRDKRDVDFDDYFAGNYGELRDVLGWAIGVNFSSFFDASPTLAASSVDRRVTPPPT